MRTESSRIIGMNEFTLYILTAIGMVFVIEGLFYALFPELIRRMMAAALTIDIPKFRQIGMIMAALGVMMVWATRMLYQ